MTDSATGVDLQTRLRLFSRLMGVLADQLDAGSAQDERRLQKLQLERESIESELDAETPEVARELRNWLTEATEQIEDLLSQGGSGEDGWTRLEEGALRVARSVRPRRVAPMDYKEFELETATIDVRY